VFTTLVAVISVLALVLPGFVIADLQRRKRASVAADSDWELVLRALSYSLILHLVASPWTRSLVLKVEDGGWQDHVSALVLYGAVVLVAVPVAVGLALNEVLLRAERSGQKLRWWHYALGGRDARQGWDYIFQRIEQGRWIVLKLASGRAVAGKLGRGSWASQSPATSGHDLWLQEIWSVDDFGRPAAMVEPRQGMWVARESIEALFVIEPPED
jgi:Family of unknown function (DUF6338)